MQIIEFVKIRATEQVAINTQEKEIEYFRLHSAILVNLIALVCTKIRATEQVAINTQEKEIRVDSCDSWANKKSVVKRLRGQKYSCTQ